MKSNKLIITIKAHILKALSRLTTFAIIGISFLSISCQYLVPTNQPHIKGGILDEAKIVLIGEDHGIDWIIDKEFSIWKDLYNKGFRHLFIEISYFDGEYLNAWMRSKNDDIYEALFLDKKGTSFDNKDIYEFYKRIKRECPLTVFHGTDIGHQYDLTGKRFLEYLTKNNLQNSRLYNLTLESISQGKKYYNDDLDRERYRENCMAQNFIREYKNIGNTRMVGIYGSAHTNYNKQAFFGDYPCMAKELRAHYGDVIYFENYRFNFGMRILRRLMHLF
ncbi:MAG: hypothetical protein LBC98_09235 [Prevotellaceae bacterium]|jgi:hypothetical protein|nr:hypothetical protein [Prevotellaceae bacterium]